MELKNDLRQRHLEAWEEAYNDAENVVGKARLDGHIVRSAIRANWFMNGAAVEQVDDMHPADVSRLSQEINQLYVDITTVEKRIAQVVQAARNEAKPPKELTYAWHCKRWGHLPEAGGLLDQPAGLLDKMSQYLNIYDATTQYLAGGAAWAEKNHDAWELYAAARVIEKEYGN